ncbi:hypothetical protein GGS26DRAFT_441555 [Hypomontagnella submonticulosa]|nr:hypothetical protein GGS26DRAFT_441555 [Hypomontagnella submonticulosa]
MSLTKTWFLPPDFTFKEDSLQLGTVLPHPAHPSKVLLEPSEVPELGLPPVQTLIEAGHNHTRSTNSSIGGEIKASISELASLGTNLNLQGRNVIQYGTVSHEVRSFSRSLSKATLELITAQPAVRRHIDSGLFGKRPVYVISGLRIAVDSMGVTKEKSYTRGGGANASGPVTAAPVELGAEVHGERGKDVLDSYETAPGIVFAYRVNVIRQKRDGYVESEIFAHKTAFMTGMGEDDEEQIEMEAVEVTKGVLEDDLEEEIDTAEHQLSNGDTYISFSV